jgi:TniQ
MKLLRRAKPYPTESLAGYLIRLASINHYSSGNLILSKAGIKERLCHLNVFDSNQDNLSTLSNMTGVSESNLLSMAFYIKTNRHSYTNQVNGFGEIFSTSLLNDSCFTICPSCLAEKPYYPQVWDLRHVTVCPFHKCRLVDSCPVCGQIINLSSPNLLRCKKCDFSFNDWFEKGIFEEWLLSAYIYQQVSIPDVDLVLSRFHEANPDFLPPFFAIPFLSLDALRYLTYEDIYFLDNVSR